MIRNKNDINHISLDTIHNEILNLSTNIGECKSSISHIESSIYHGRNEICSKLDDLNSRLNIIEKKEYVRTSRNDFIWKLVEASPFNIFKWFSLLSLLSYFLIESTNPGLLHKVSQLAESIIK